ncbi:glycosyltransferase family 4 protein [Paraburkholderia hayleyella]|uniref:glycosyltransferase family 4 protein n=1 Tax=Paraburkholderia hayleyella TaxID=2152889 RepID=UPI0012918596|nr:glycosyltransferase family 4 protein [Paraburkholderia hayleyella]
MNVNSPTTRLRVVLLTEAAAGGIAVHLADLIRELCARGGIDVHLIVPRGPRFDATILDAQVVAQCASFHAIDMHRSVGWRDARSFMQVLHCLRRIRPDIVHSHSSKAGVLGRLCPGSWQNVYTPHAVYTLNPYLPRFQRSFYGAIEALLGRFRSNRIVAVSEHEAQHLHRVLHIPSGRIATIPNGVDTAPLLPCDSARRALGLRHDAIVVGFVGRLDFQKGVDRLAQIAQALEHRFADRLQFVVIGPGDFAAAAGLANGSIPKNVRVPGALTDARRYFSAFDMLVLPSRYEGFPYVCLEAIAAGVPIVATRVAGAAELIEAWHVGLVVSNEDDTGELERAIAELATNEGLRQQMSTNCKAAHEHFGVEAMVDRTLTLYQSLLEPTV